MMMKFLSVNVGQGGFANGYDMEATFPARLPHLQAVLLAERQTSGLSATLSDTFRWGQIYATDQAIAQALDMSFAKHVLLDDDSMQDEAGKHIGITFATTEKVHSSEPLDLDTRQGIKTVLDTGKYGLQVISVYLHWFDNERRKNSLKALFSNIEPDMPTIIKGDFNTLRPRLGADASLRTKALDVGVRATCHAFGKLPRNWQAAIGDAAHGPDIAVINTIRSMNQRDNIPIITAHGFTDADPKSQPTAPSRWPVLGVDYAFGNDRLKLSQFRVVDSERARMASDHLPIVFDANVISPATT